MANFPAFSLLIFILILAAAPSRAQDGGVAAQPLWCVARNNAEDSALQAALDWACGAGGADCGPIQQGGPCYDSNDLIGMASYAFNDYCLKHGMSDDSCNFSNNAALTALNPSHDKCKFPSSSSANSSGPSTSAILGDTSGSVQHIAVIEACTLAFLILVALTIFH